ncbi:hypothetical protein CAPTEDRAFT_213856 [Capitella teleta]|uniref:Endonuclease/exonuclease/phosphatase domain-containing protein n=1 Tax=Capitella teleta TaxID=283909 RepID=R7U821_CAPTE|nr:hypothetical protein CAPTEDRAFT_213856 [Capitella teleta]|eukprot:ELT99270.1 hypothetical protein CAPTEDRAFT_213856 [Capitella teleta]
MKNPMGMKIFVPMPGRKKNKPRLIRDPAPLTALSVLYTNADSLLNKMVELECRVANKNPTVIAITEAFPKHSTSTILHQEFLIKNYNLIWNGDSPNKHRGICIYIQESIQYSVVEDAQYHIFKESIWLKLRSDSREKLLLGVIYRSPTADIGEQENNALLMTTLNRAATDPSPYNIIMRDFPFISWQHGSGSFTGPERETEHQFIQTLDDNFLEQIVEEPTTQREGQTANTLDLIITNNTSTVVSVNYTPPLGKSDHSTLEISMDLNSYILPQKENTSKVVMEYDGKKCKMMRVDNRSDDRSTYTMKTSQGKAQFVWSQMEKNLGVLVDGQLI